MNLLQDHLQIHQNLFAEHMNSTLQFSFLIIKFLKVPQKKDDKSCSYMVGEWCYQFMDFALPANQKDLGLLLVVLLPLTVWAKPGKPIKSITFLGSQLNWVGDLVGIKC